MKVVSFSLWGDEKAFAAGAIANAMLVPKIYPGWQAVFFCGQDVGVETTERLLDCGGMVVTMPVGASPWQGLFWRFHPIFSEATTHTIIRDCDSRVNPREAAAVAEWMESGKTLHVMRDHIEHILPIMGGMWGCKHWPEFKTLLDGWARVNEKGDDQIFLAEKVWPLLSCDSITHDKWPNGTDYDISEKDPVYKVFRYRPVEFHGPHDIREFPRHEPFDLDFFGGHVGARVGTA